MWDILLPALVLAITGFILGGLIFIVGKAFYVEEDPSIEEVVELLPKYNCGACGYPGCKEMASGLLAGEAKPALCKPMKKEAIPALEAYLKEYFAKKKEA
ncbi:MAG: electron transporter RnfB [Bacilli bacterium]|nr:electron transporter RnfB [Bacilli bacterium]MBN2876362.1 electron transporter RnfB [Bacilli bacterium]